MRRGMMGRVYGVRDVKGGYKGFLGGGGFKKEVN